MPSTVSALPIKDKAGNTLPTPEQIRLLQDSFQTVSNQGEAFVARFYENLFTLYPSTRFLFEQNRLNKTQKQVLNSLVVAIHGLRDPDKLRPYLQQLGARHVRYGVLPGYLPMFEPAAILTLKEFLAPTWNQPLEQAWCTALRTVIAIMQEGIGQTHLLEVDAKGNIGGVATRAALLNREPPRWYQRLAEICRNTPKWLVTLCIFVAVIVLFVTSDKFPFIASLLDRAEQISILMAVLLWFQEIPARKQQAIYDAFQVIDSARGSRTSPARVMALEALAESHVSLQGMDLSRICLAGIRLRDISLAGASLAETDLRQADLCAANLLEANLAKTQLSEADLSRACLSFADLSEADLNLANLEGADLTCANLANANLTGANLKGAKLAGSELRKTILAGANLLVADLTGVDLTNVDLRGAVMPDGKKRDD